MVSGSSRSRSQWNSSSRSSPCSRWTCGRRGAIGAVTWERACDIARHLRIARRMAIYALGDRTPDIHPEAFVHPDATVIGDVVLGAEASVWPGAVLRGDYGRIEVGARTSIQDGTVIHATHDLATVIGHECVVGHVAHLEGCVVEDYALVGSG